MNDIEKKKSEEYEALSYIGKRCMVEPEFIKKVMEYAIAGIQSRILKLTKHASDMEAAVSAMAFIAGEKKVTPALKQQINELVLDKIESHIHESFLKWSHIVVSKEEPKDD